MTLTAPSVPWDPLVYTRLLLSHCPEGSVHSRSFRDSCLGTLDSVVLNCVLSQPLTQAVDRASCLDALGITLFYASATRSVAWPGFTHFSTAFLSLCNGKPKDESFSFIFYKLGESTSRGGGGSLGQGWGTSWTQA